VVKGENLHSIVKKEKGGEFHSIPVPELSRKLKKNLRRRRGGGRLEGDDGEKKKRTSGPRPRVKSQMRSDGEGKVPCFLKGKKESAGSPNWNSRVRDSVGGRGERGGSHFGSKKRKIIGSPGGGEAEDSTARKEENFSSPARHEDMKKGKEERGREGSFRG